MRILITLGANTAYPDLYRELERYPSRHRAERMRMLAAIGLAHMGSGSVAQQQLMAGNPHQAAAAPPLPAEPQPEEPKPSRQQHTRPPKEQAGQPEGLVDEVADEEPEEKLAARERLKARMKNGF